MGATLDLSYRHLTRLHRRHDPRAAAATDRLPRVLRHHVHALAGFAAVPDTATHPPTDAAALVDRLEAAIRAGRSDDLVLWAVAHTHRAFGLPTEPWRRRLLDPPSPGDVAAQLTSARELATLVLPVLDPSDPRAGDHLGDLAAAATLTRLLETAAAGTAAASPEDDRRRATTLGRARRLLVAADLGLRWFPPSSAQALRTHRLLLASALTDVEQAGPTPDGRPRRPSPARRLTVRWASRAHRW